MVPIHIDLELVLREVGCLRYFTKTWMLLVTPAGLSCRERW